MKAKQTILLLLFLLPALAGVFWLVFDRNGSETEVVLLEETEVAQPPRKTAIRDPLVLAYGWSDLPDAADATDAALGMMREAVPDPRFILTFYTGPYKAEIIKDRIREAFADAKLLGMESANAVFSPAGLHDSASGAVVVLGFDAADLAVGVGGDEVDEHSDHQQVAQNVIAQARADAGQSADQSPGGIICGQVMGFSEIYCEALNEQFNKITPMIGGNPITSQVTQGSIIVNDRVYARGFALALIYTDKKIGANFHGGFSGRIKHGQVTAVDPSDNHIIVTIDGRPALEVYNEWADNRFRKYLGLQEPVIVNESVLTPLSKSIQLEGGDLHHLTLHPWKFNPDGSINGGVTVNVGDRLYYVEGDEQVLVQRCGAVVRKAMIEGQISYRTAVGGVHIYCVGAGKYLGFGPDGRAREIVDNINGEMKGKPFIGGFFGGEQGTVQGYGFFAGNLMSAMMVFSEESE